MKKKDFICENNLTLKRLYFWVWKKDEKWLHMWKQSHPKTTLFLNMEEACSSYHLISIHIFLRSPEGGVSHLNFIYSGPKRSDKVTHLFTTAHVQAQGRKVPATKVEKRREKRRRARATTALPQTPRHMNSLTMPPGRWTASQRSHRQASMKRSSTSALAGLSPKSCARGVE